MSRGLQSASVFGRAKRPTGVTTTRRLFQDSKSTARQRYSSGRRWRRLGWREHRQGDRWQAWDLDDRRTRRVVAEGADGGGGVLVVGGALAAGDVLGAVAGAGLAVDAGVGLPSTPARESVREVHCFGDLRRVWAAQSTGMSVG
jgi:hypothetical protein